MSKIQSIRGMNDLLPAQSGGWQQIEAIVADVLSQYGYSEIRFPILEKTDLFFSEKRGGLTLGFQVWFLWKSYMIQILSKPFKSEKQSEEILS